MTSAPALELRGITKRFGMVRALDGVDLTVNGGEVHALIGENGAGKSTLMHIAYGMVRPDGGDGRVFGASHLPASPRDARALGVGMVHQHFTSIPSLTVAENIALAAGWPVKPGRLRSQVTELTSRTGLPLDPDAPVESLTVALKQRLEIVKALAGDARILLLDEPSSVLAPAEVDELLRMVRRFAEAGNAVVMITHKLDEALAVADRVTVLRRGAVMLTGSAGSQTSAALAAAMIGAAAQPAPPPPSTRTSGKVQVQARSLRLDREGRRGQALFVESLEVRSGEIVGVAGVEGNGQRELLRAVAGVGSVAGGALDVAGPVAFVPEDRTTEGLIPEMTLTENFVLGLGADAPWIHRGRVRWPAARARMAAVIEEFDIRAAGPAALAGSLSGGNQQKVVVARALERAPRVLVAENPTRGLDLRAAAAVHARLRAAAGRGAAVLFFSSDLDEVLELADRVLVAAGGVAVEAPARAGRTEIGSLMVTGG